jgi:hypothetical protein
MAALPGVNWINAHHVQVRFRLTYRERTMGGRELETPSKVSIARSRNRRLAAHQNCFPAGGAGTMNMTSHRNALVEHARSRRCRLRRDEPASMRQLLESASWRSCSRDQAARINSASSSEIACGVVPRVFSLGSLSRCKPMSFLEVKTGRKPKQENRFHFPACRSLRCCLRRRPSRSALPT